MTWRQGRRSEFRKSPASSEATVASTGRKRNDAKQLAYSVNEVQKNVKTCCPEMREGAGGRRKSITFGGRISAEMLGFATQVEGQVSNLIEKVAETTVALRTISRPEQHDH